MDSTNNEILLYKIKANEESLEKLEKQIELMDKAIIKLTLWRDLLRYTVIGIAFITPLSIPITGWAMKSYVNEIVVQELAKFEEKIWQQHHLYH